MTPMTRLTANWQSFQWHYSYIEQIGCKLTTKRLRDALIGIEEL